MSMRHEVTRFVGDGVSVRIDGKSSLKDLTQTINIVCARAEDSPTPSVVVLSLGTTRPEDRAWPGTADIGDVNRWERAVRRLERLPAVSISVATDTCGGPALDVLLATDYRIATADFRLLLPVNEGHFWPGMAAYRLVHQVGVGRARQLVLWGHELAAQRAVELGLVDEIAAEPTEAVRAAALLLGRVSGRDLAVRRQLLLEASTTSFEEAIGPHLAACDRELRRIHGDREPGV